MISSKRVVLAGDWNTVLDTDLDPGVANKGTKIPSSLKDFQSKTFDKVDFSQMDSCRTFSPGFASYIQCKLIVGQKEARCASLLASRDANRGMDDKDEGSPQSIASLFTFLGCVF